MFSEQMRTGKPLVKIDANRTIRPTEETQQLEVKGSEGEGSDKPKTLSEVVVLCSVQKKKWLMNKNETIISN